MSSKITDRHADLAGLAALHVLHPVHRPDRGDTRDRRHHPGDRPVSIRPRSGRFRPCADASRPAQRGQVLVMFAGGLIALLAVVGLVIDGGTVFFSRRDDQNASGPRVARWDQAPVRLLRHQHGVHDDRQPVREDPGEPRQQRLRRRERLHLDRALRRVPGAGRRIPVLGTRGAAGHRGISPRRARSSARRLWGSRSTSRPSRGRTSWASSVAGPGTSGRARPP